MLTDFFRSEPEVQASFNVSNCVPFKFSNDPEAVVFYSTRYEDDLLMKYLGESGPGESVDESSAEFTNYGSFIDELPSYCYIDPTRSPDCLRERTSYSDEVMMSTDSAVSFDSDVKPVERPASPPKPSISKPTRRGRPMKVTSTSKMANYARNYREQKKNQLAACEAQVRELTEENKFLRAENKRLTEGYARLKEQVDALRKMVENNSYFSRDPLQTPSFSGPAYDKNSINDLFDINELMMFSQ